MNAILAAAAAAAICGYGDAPYHRYEAEAGKAVGAAVLRGPSLDQAKIEAQASDNRYVELGGKGAAVEWVMAESGCNGVTLRFTMPDREDGWKQDDKNAEVPQYRRDQVFTGSLEIYVNGKKRQIEQYGKVSDAIPLSSYWMWQYFVGDHPFDEPTTPHEFSRFAFDEVHFVLKGAPLRKGDAVRLVNADGKYPYGVDFIETEPVPAPIAKPANALSVADFGTGREAIDKCLAACREQKKAMYFPAGVWEYYRQGGDNRWLLNDATEITITGAGVWHTNLHFPSSKSFGGGVGGNRNGKNLEFCHMYLSSMLRSRFDQNAVYKGIMEAWGEDAKIHDLWIEHFECGMWFGDYQGPAKITKGAKIYSCRLRNNLADGINLCQGTSETVIEHCSFRGNGDDGIAIWNNDACGAPDAFKDTIRFNTVECNWRAGGIAIFGGDGHVIADNLVKDCFKGAGIRLNTDFPGYQFRNTKNILFKGNRIVNCGTSWDCYGNAAKDQPSERGSVDLHGDVRNITFEDTVIIDSHRCAIQMRGTDHGTLKFTNTTVDRLGLDGGAKSRYTHASDVGPGRVLFLAGAIKPEVDGLVIRNVAKENLFNELCSEDKFTWGRKPEFK